MTKTHEATVEVLTAEVRVLMVGSRQVTLSVARQLDEESPFLVQPFGRIRTGSKDIKKYDLEVIGSKDGTLARSRIGYREQLCEVGYSSGFTWHEGREFTYKRCPGCRQRYTRDGDHEWVEYVGGTLDIYLEWQALPLIVLAGLR